MSNLVVPVLPPIDDTPPPNVVAHRGPPTPRRMARLSSEWQDARLAMRRASFIRTVIPAEASLQTADLLLRDPTPSAMIQFFIDNDGMVETPDGSNRCPVTEWFDRWYDAWCIMSCSFALCRSGFTLDDETVFVPDVRQTQAKGWAYTPAVARCFDDAGMFSTTPSFGSIAIAVWPTSGNWTDPDWRMPGDHGCAVEWVLDGGQNVIPWKEDGFPEDPAAVASIVTRDGNIGNAMGQHHRSIGTYHGFCHPHYARRAQPKPYRSLIATILSE